MTQPWGPVAMIGTRSLDAVPKEVVRAFQHIAQAIGRSNGVVRTGAAKGADQIAAEACLKADGYVRLVLPWASYEETWRQQIHRAYPDRVFETVYQPDRHPEWAESVRMHHPAPERLTRGAFALHARNYGIIIGRRTPAVAVIAVPKSLEPGQEGGTGQGIRIAHAHRIPVVNLLQIYHTAGIEAVYQSASDALRLHLR